MRVVSTTLLILILSCIAAGQRMTDRDLYRLKGKVKTVEERSQKVASDGTPLEEPKIDSESTYNEGGDLVEKIDSDFGQRRTKYFLYKGERVLKSEYIGEDPRKNIKVPANAILEEEKNGPYDRKLKYKYDKAGRIIQVSRNADNPMLSSYAKFAYDDSGRMISQVYSSANGALETTNLYKYDDSGILTKMVSEDKLGTNVHPPKGYDKFPRTSLFSEYVLDKNGNWIQRKITNVDKDGKVQGIQIEVRLFTYY
jgi:hypothetical protein